MAGLARRVRHVRRLAVVGMANIDYVGCTNIGYANTGAVMTTFPASGPTT